MWPAPVDITGRTATQRSPSSFSSGGLVFPIRYVLAGAGAMIFDPTDRSIGNGVGRQTKAAFVYGGGLNFDITRNFGVRTEYRGLVYNVPDFTLSSLHLDKTTHLAQPSVGFFFRF